MGNMMACQVKEEIFPGLEADGSRKTAIGAGNPSADTGARRENFSFQSSQHNKGFVSLRSIWEKSLYCAVGSNGRLFLFDFFSPFYAQVIMRSFPAFIHTWQIDCLLSLVLQAVSG